MRLTPRTLQRLSLMLQWCHSGDSGQCTLTLLAASEYPAVLLSAAEAVTTRQIRQPDDRWDQGGNSASREWTSWRLTDIFSTSDLVP